MRVLIIATLALAASGAQALAQDSAANASAAGGASSEVAGHLAASGVQAVVGVAALPVSAAAGASVVGGSAVATAGAGSAAVGGGLSEAAGHSADFASGPLKVDDKVVVSPDPMPAVPYNAQKPNP